ncbi:MAG TPA: AAA family ATPase, partial [Tepidisphaeraceae bacterium]|nr:AAA family ATPase [Tepidisphaeraceae bacterium]
MRDVPAPLSAAGPRRIHLTGASGSGTTTLGRALGQRLGLAHLDTDDFYWLPTDPPYQAARPMPDRLARLEAALDVELGWVLSGSLAGWGDPLLERFEAVVFLAVPVKERLRRLEARERARYGAA